MTVDFVELSKLAVSVLTGGVALTLIYAGRMIWKKLDRLLNQTENNHREAEYPNLRDEVTASRKTIEETKKAIVEISSAVREIREDNRAIRREQEGSRDDLRNVSARLDHHINNPCP
jgi:predicted  nucleic acid-binding Zn-ribbon protein